MTNNNYNSIVGFTNLAAAVIAACGTLACISYAPPAEPVQKPVGGAIARNGAMNGPREQEANAQDALASALASFGAQVASMQASGSVGVLPIPTWTPERREPHFTDLSEHLASRASDAVRSHRTSSLALVDLEGMRLRLVRANIARSELVSVEALGTRGLRLGLDAVITGSVRVNQGLGQLDTITVKLAAYNLKTSQSLATLTVDVPRGPSNRHTWDLVQRTSLMDSAVWTTPVVERSLADELTWMTEALASDLVLALPKQATQSLSLYVAPTETEAMGMAGARLRAAQKAWSEIWSARLARAEAGAQSGTTNQAHNEAVRLDGVDFATADQAIEYLARLRETYAATPQANFGRNVSSQLKGQLTRMMVQSPVKLRDLQLSKAGDLAMLEGELASLGALRSSKVRKLLLDADVQLVATPRLEALGEALLLRVELHDVATGDLLASTHWPIAGKYNQELKALISSSETTGKTPVVGSLSWEEAFQKVVTGVARVVTPVNGGLATGTAFLVDDRGFLLTNAHVVEGATDDITVEFRDGARAKATIVAKDAFWDVAVLKLAGAVKERHVFSLGTKGRVGQEVAIVGHPRDTQGWVLAIGNISSVTEVAPTSGERPSYMYNCHTRGGNSGSPVFALNGEVVALHSHGLSGTVNADALSGVSLYSEMPGFALGAPSDRVAEVVLPILRKY